MSEANPEDVEPRRGRRKIVKEEGPFVIAQTPPVTPPSLPAPPAPAGPQLSPEQTQQLNLIIGEMLTIASELGLEMATTECSDALTCPVFRKGKELVKQVKKLRTLLKEVSQ